MSGFKRARSENSEGKTLEETVFEYIDQFQERENGEGVGITCDHLNRNIVHPDKPTGSGSEARFVALMRDMPTLIEGEQKWKGKTVFLLNDQQCLADEQQSELLQAQKLLTAVTDDMLKRVNELHPLAARVSIRRKEFEGVLEDLLTATDLLAATSADG